ncbi:MAG: DUF1349 domain-containing protein [Chloroflexota bacterium]|nr:DUF1349 domain-containing protein [Chloroflexota bacterium]
MPELRLDERFVSPALDPRLAWRREPRHWQVEPEAGRLRVEPDGETDFWQRTHYGFQVDNGHFLFAEVGGSFRLATRVSFEPAHQYDQAGLMVRLSEDFWLKTSIEHEPGTTNRLGVVVTNAGYSDWSTQDVPSELREIWLRVERTGADYLVESSTTGTSWSQLRLAHLHRDDGLQPVAAGLYACSPKAPGYVAEFAFLSIEPLTS